MPLFTELYIYLVFPLHILPLFHSSFLVPLDLQSAVQQSQPDGSAGGRYFRWQHLSVHWIPAYP